MAAGPPAPEVIDSDMPEPASEFFTDLWKTSISPQLRLEPDVDIHPVEHRLSSEVFQAESGGKSLILRWYPAEEPSRLKSYLEASDVFSDLGLRIPERIGEGSTPQGTWILEKKVEGKSFRDLPGNFEAHSQAAKALALLHSHESRRYGKAGAWKGRYLSVRWKQRFHERWLKIRNLFPELVDAEAETAHWFQDWCDAFAPSRYQLLHGDYHPGNLILGQDGQVVFLDFRSPRYGFGLVEMVEAAHFFCGEEPGDWNSFVPVYLEHRDKNTRDLDAHFATSIHAVFHLRQADRFSDLAVGRKGTRQDHRRWVSNALDSWQRFCDLAGIVSPLIEGSSETAFPCRVKSSPGLMNSAGAVKS